MTDKEKQEKIDDRFAKFMTAPSRSEFEQAQLKKIVKQAQTDKK